MTESKRVGRPKSENSKNRKVTVRMTEQQFHKLERVANKVNLTKTETILRGIDLQDTEQ
ncbi:MULTISPECIES: hypothetical protein [Streptococcus]|uniref:hypothetical protein n=1 Tax=Streptococcus TaxID=1301 RepID=UPI00031207E4|nr:MULTISPECIES: hypothetical protein [Streptococcus]EPX15478.1 hypothetical protein SAG0169_07085 [Streptococcus agalactiae LDS 610]QBX23489.1 hypothetical protein Javan132_0055 [Streptococcus phage Javan132]EPV89976.1 hypothetical protein SAG0023_06255 [Streptococcus agalactiae FSL S3-105]MCQ3822961.1 hypothetical protein [Streptococcus agalactiae]MCQ3825317.1 hypothetical protein [Streptococcus agalactiae]